MRQSGDGRSLFEYNLDYYDLSIPIKFIGKPQKVPYTPYTGQIPSAPRQAPSQDEIDENDEDPLRPSLFRGHHRRMEKEGRRIQEIERQNLESEATVIMQQKNALMGPYWQQEIPKIVKIVKNSDVHEMKTKRRLALDEMTQFLRKFNDMETERKRRNRRESSVSKPQPVIKKPPVKKTVRFTSPPVPHPKVWISFGPYAFGYSIPPISAIPREFDIPESWKLEAQTPKLRFSTLPPP